MSTEVVCVGILVADIASSPIESLPASGELRLTERFVLRVGGCAANTAVDLRRLGRTVKVLGKVGEDLFGEFVVRDLERLGVDTSAVARSRNYPTSTTCIINVRGEDRRFITSIGANGDFSIADIDFSVLDGARALYVGGYLLMPRFTPDDLTALLREAKKRGLTTALDVVIPAESCASLESLEKALPYTDVFLPNSDEAQALTGQKQPIRQAEVLAGLSPDCTIVITQGRAGTLARHQGRVIQTGIYQVDTVDHSGAGDAFDAGFLVGLLENWPLERTLRLASAVGASCTRALGCTDGVFGFEEALAFIEENPFETRVIE